MPHAIVLGAGIAGLAAAHRLVAIGWSVELVEPDMARARPGHAFIVQDNGIRALRRLGVGVHDPLPGACLDRFDLCTPDGILAWSEPLPGARGILRRDCVSALAAPLEGAVSWVTGRVAGLERLDSGHYRVLLADGECREADLIVAADGVGSAARAALFPDTALTPIRVVERVFPVEDTRLREWLGTRCVKFEDPAGGLALGLVPCGPDRITCYTQRCAAADERDPLGHSPEALLRQLFRGWHPAVAQALDAGRFRALHRWPTTDLDPLPRHHRGNVVLLGDAAHPMLPFTSQGVNAALEDALSLVDALEGMTSRYGLAEALEVHGARRAAHVAPVVIAGRRLRDRFLDPAAHPGEPAAPLVK